LIKIYYQNIAEIAIISANPLILYIPIDIDISGFVQNYRRLFDSIKHRSANVICCTYWYFEKEKHVRQLADTVRQYGTDHPNLKFTFLANTPEQNELFAAACLDTILCNHNALVDERLFFPIEYAVRTIDAVYDARLAEWKRHRLAAQIEKLGLIYHRAPVLEDAAYVEQIKNELAYARFFNHDDSGVYVTLTPNEVNEALNQCRVGLCLSETEGAMFASIQYLLAGLPVVTTLSRGGRDVFFDDEIAITVEPTPDAVREGVREMIGRRLDAGYVRAKTLARMRGHRERFVELVQTMFGEAGVERDYAADFQTSFTNKLLKRVNLNSIIGMLEPGGSIETDGR